MKFEISRNQETLFTVRAATYDLAAGMAARKLYGRKATSTRTSGTVGMSGYFRAHVPVQGKHSGMTSVGEDFHVRAI